MQPPYVQYYYSYGNEDVLGGEIKLIYEGNNKYTLTFEQMGFDVSTFEDVRITELVREISYDINDSLDEEGLTTRIIILKFAAFGNYAPETLFRRYHKIIQPLKMIHCN